MCINEVKSQDQYCFIKLGLIREKKKKNPNWPYHISLARECSHHAGID